MNKVPFPSSQDKWIAVGMWAAVLVLIIFGSNAIVLSLSYVLSFTSMYQYANITFPMGVWIASALPIIAMAFFVLRAWNLFFRFSKRLFIALGKNNEEIETGSVFYPFLFFKNKKSVDGSSNLPSSAENATGNIISSLIWMIALGYLMVIVEMMIISMASLFMNR